MSSGLVDDMYILTWSPRDGSSSKGNSIEILLKFKNQFENTKGVIGGRKSKKE